MSMVQRQATGSRLLGQELRRLRGMRRLQDVARLSKVDLPAGTTKPLSVASLSEIENGKYLPSLETLVTLCLTYKVSPARFVGRVLEERLIAGHDVPEGAEELEAQATAAMREGRWPRALALVLVGIERAHHAADVLRWRLRHAQVLTNTGMLDQALHELKDVLDAPALARELRPRVHLDIANAASRAGHVTDAAFHCDAALAHADEGAPPAFRLRALQTSVAVTLRRSVLGFGTDRELREAQRRIEEARGLLPQDDPSARLALDVYQAQVEHRLGHRSQAQDLYRRIEGECERLGNGHLGACVLISHAELLVESGHEDRARPRLEQAARLATDSHAVDHAFEAHFSLIPLSRTDRERELHRRACRRLMTMATSPTPRMREFEAALAAGERS